MIDVEQQALRLRRMTRDDLDEVERIELAAHRHPWTRELLARELDHDWSTVLLAVSDDGGRESIFGYIVFWFVHDEIHVLNVATDPVRRRRGAARLLMLEAERLGRQRGAQLSTLEVRRSNDAAIALYRGLGYRQVGMRPRYYSPDGEDAIVMTKSLGPDTDEL